MSVHADSGECTVLKCDLSECMLDPAMLPMFEAHFVSLCCCTQNARAMGEWMPPLHCDSMQRHNFIVLLHTAYSVNIAYILYPRMYLIIVYRCS